MRLEWQARTLGHPCDIAGIDPRRQLRGRKSAVAYRLSTFELYAARDLPVPVVLDQQMDVVGGNGVVEHAQPVAPSRLDCQLAIGLAATGRRNATTLSVVEIGTRWHAYSP